MENASLTNNFLIVEEIEKIGDKMLEKVIGNQLVYDLSIAQVPSWEKDILGVSLAVENLDEPRKYIILHHSRSEGSTGEELKYYDSATICSYELSNKGIERALNDQEYYLSNPSEIVYTKLSYEEKMIKKEGLSESDYLLLKSLEEQLGLVEDRMDKDEDFKKLIKEMRLNFDIGEEREIIDANIHIPTF